MPIQTIVIGRAGPARSSPAARNVYIEVDVSLSITGANE
jgi:hypothetical protein